MIYNKSVGVFSAKTLKRTPYWHGWQFTLLSNYTCARGRITLTSFPKGWKMGEVEDKWEVGRFLVAV
jgi:hypothetical protein